MKIVFLHPDLGIGGAERLVVDAAVALKDCGHSVEFLTNHYDPKHCFSETKGLGVTVVGARLPRNVFGYFHALCAYLRFIYAAYYLVYKSEIKPDVVICDQISACIPLLRKAKIKVIYYCHFPDLLLTSRESFMKRIYRAPLDWLEERTTGMADLVLVNSRFTANVFRQTFTQLSELPIEVLYPTLNFSSFDRPLKGDLSIYNLKNVQNVFLSINRYERKKNLALALESFAYMLTKLDRVKREGVHLIIAGGYDLRVIENVEYYKELVKLADQLEISEKITFLKSPLDEEKHLLLHSCTVVIYTPQNEHFGIVPLEAMYMSRPVIAANSGGPLETVIDGETGFSCKPVPEEFGERMERFVKDRSLAREMGEAGHRRVKEKFRFEHFKMELNKFVTEVWF